MIVSIVGFVLTVLLILISFYIGVEFGKQKIIWLFYDVIDQLGGWVETNRMWSSKEKAAMMCSRSMTVKMFHLMLKIPYGEKID